MKRITVNTLRDMKRAGEKIASLTAYDASFARILDENGIEVILVGDSLGMVVQGQETTLPVTLDEMIYHTRMVCAGSQRALILADMPFMSDNTPQQALENAGQLMKEGGAHMVKLEGGEPMVETVRALSLRGIPVCAHLGLLPQSVHKMGGYRVQGRDEKAAHDILRDARAMEEAGADMLLLECVPETLAAEVTGVVDIPVMGIGAGLRCDAQVLVLYDILNISHGKRPRFSKDFLQGTGSIAEAVTNYVRAVKDGSFPTAEHSF
jgi:3-methyl-2-oxobutanoate hydroxymethyltransferase